MGCSVRMTCGGCNESGPPRTTALPVLVRRADSSCKDHDQGASIPQDTRGVQDAQPSLPHIREGIYADQEKETHQSVGDRQKSSDRVAGK